MKKVFLFFLLFLHSYFGNACHCEEFTQEKEWEDSELVFIGKITESYDDYFKIEVIEIFKNSLLNEEVVFQVQINSCSINPSKGELWLIYGQLESNNLDVSSCGYSKSMSFFSKKGSSMILPPRPLYYTDKEAEIVKSLYESRVADQLFFTVNGLRIQKVEELIRKLELDIKTKNEDNSKSDVKIIIYLLALLVLASLVLNLFVLRKLNKLSKYTNRLP